MSRIELEQLEKCMDHLAYVLNKIGVTHAALQDGHVEFVHDGSPVDATLINNLCHHISSLYKEELTEKEEEDLDPDFYFTS